MSASATSSSNVQSTLEALEEQNDKMRDDHKVFMATLYGMLARLSDQPEGLLGARWAECLIGGHRTSETQDTASDDKGQSREDHLSVQVAS